MNIETSRHRDRNHNTSHQSARETKKAIRTTQNLFACKYSQQEHQKVQNTKRRKEEKENLRAMTRAAAMRVSYTLHICDSHQRKHPRPQNSIAAPQLHFKMLASESTLSCRVIRRTTQTLPKSSVLWRLASVHITLSVSSRSASVHVTLSITVQ